MEDKPCYSFMSKVTKGDYDNMQSRRTEFAINETQRGATNEKKDNVLVIDVDGKSAGKLTKKEHESLMESVFLRKQKDLNSKPCKEGKGTKVSVASLNHDFQKFGSMDESGKHETDKTLQNTACELLTEYTYQHKDIKTDPDHMRGINYYTSKGAHVEKNDYWP